MKFPLCNREAEGSARPKTSFFLKRRGPLVLKRHFSWSGGVRSPLRATEGSVAIQVVFLVAYFMHSSLKESSCLSFPFPYPILLDFLKVKRPHPPKEMKAYPEQPSGSVMLLLTTKKFSTPNVETLKAFASRDEQMAASKKRKQNFSFKKWAKIFSKKAKRRANRENKGNYERGNLLHFGGEKTTLLGSDFFIFFIKRCLKEHRYWLN